ncbi:hypothetical protein [Labilithrix luteola]|uniref:hypothetical protein n=1 Tax=Labilithrix luteola TaxID=1391654 RepID=UPI0011BAC093|nr:hypothetical protein [Labilithrix luteola]
MMHPYREAEAPEESETEKVIRQTEREMLETFARLLSESNPHELDPLTARIGRLAHERRLAIQLEFHRRMRDPRPFAFIVTADGILERVPTPKRSNDRG